MSTRGYIAIQHDDGTCEGFYNHCDNYPTGTGMTLLSTPGCATGDLKTIQKALDNDEKDWVFTHDNWADAFVEGHRHGCDWFYIRKRDVWYCVAYYKDQFEMIPVAEAIADEIKTLEKEDYEALRVTMEAKIQALANKCGLSPVEEE